MSTDELTPAARKLTLRLDDGKLIGAAATLGVTDAATPCVALDTDRAWQSGRLAGPAVGKLEDLLRLFAEKVPGGRHLKTVDLKRRASDAFELQDDTPVQRQRSAPQTTPRANGHAYADEPASPTSAGGGGSWHVGEFEEICMDIIQKQLWPMFGQQIIYFDHPVEVNIVPDYYKVIPKENARDLGSMKTKLQRRRYKSPQQFYDLSPHPTQPPPYPNNNLLYFADMHLFLHNIVLYNGPSSDFGKLSNRVGKVFEDAWASAGLAGATRARRATAGVARPKYEPAPPEKRPLARSSSARSVGRAAAQPRAAARPQGAQSAAARAPPSRGEMSRDQMQQLAEVLGSIEGEELEGVLNIIRDSTNLPAGGEIELDFDMLSHETLWQLEDYLRKINKGTGVGAAATAPDTSFRVEAESDSEEDESESDSAD